MKKNKGLTGQQIEIIKYIIEWQRTTGRETIPVYQEVGNALGISKQHANVVIGKLARQGFLNLGSDKFCEVRVSITDGLLRKKRYIKRKNTELESMLNTIQGLRDQLNKLITNSNLSNAQKIQILEDERFLLRGF